MNFFKSLFTSTPQQQARSQVQKYIDSVGVHTRFQALPLTFQYQLTSSFNNCQSPTIFMQQLIGQLSTTKNVSSTVKLFTIIHNAIHERDYNKDELQSLQQLGSVVISQIEESKWFSQFCICYSSYLKKLPSVADIYKRAKSANLSKTPASQFLIEVFRIINQISLLFPSICTSTNVIGRYYATTYPQFPQFYRMLNNYMKLMIDQILLTYRELDVEQLKGFMKTMPEIELTCDKIEDLLLNKYFKGKSIKGKIYLRQQKVQEICYYLEYQLEGKHFQQQGDTLSTNIRRENIQIHDNDQ